MSKAVVNVEGNLQTIVLLVHLLEFYTIDNIIPIRIPQRKRESMYLQWRILESFGIESNDKILYIRDTIDAYLKENEDIVTPFDEKRLETFTKNVTTAALQDIALCEDADMYTVDNTEIFGSMTANEITDEMAIKYCKDKVPEKLITKIMGEPK